MSNLDHFVQQVQQDILREAREIYSDVVIGHWLQPRNAYAMRDPSGHARVVGPCGDTMEIFIAVEAGSIRRASFVTNGCISSVVCGSMAVELATGQPLEQARAIDQGAILVALHDLPPDSRHCALLAATTLQAAIESLSQGSSAGTAPAARAGPGER